MPELALAAAGFRLAVGQLRIGLAIGVWCLALSLASCSTTKVILAQEREAVLAAERAWAAAASQRDLDRSVSFMSDDAVMYPPSSAPIVGKAAIREYMASGFATPGFSVTWDPETVVIADSGNFAYTRSRSIYTVPGPDGGILTIHGKGIAIWRRNLQGEWHCVVDIWNDAPPPSDVAEQ